MSADFRPLKLKEQSSGVLGDYYSGTYFQLGAIGLSSASRDDRLSMLLEILPVAWTKNELVKVFGQEFLATYILEPSLAALQEFASGKPLPSLRLKLKLMKTDQIGSIEPYPELNKEKYLEILQKLSGTGEAVVGASARTAALSNIKQAALSMIMYSADYDDVMPYVQTSKTLVKVTAPYARDNSIWMSTHPKASGPFRFNMSLAGVSMTDVPEPANTPMLYDNEVWPDGKRLVAFTDGHAKFISTEEWESLQKYFKLKLKRHGKPIKPDGN